MNAAISTMADLERWFRRNNCPFFILSTYSTSSPTGFGQVLSRNDVEGEMEGAWQLLSGDVSAQTGRGRAQLHVVVWDKGKTPNNPTARTNLDIAAGFSSAYPAQNAGIAGIGVADIQSEIQKALSAAREKWEMEAKIQALEEARDAETDPLEKWTGIFERIAATPIGAAIVTKILGGATLPAAMVAQPVNGFASTDTAPDAAHSEEPDTFETDLQAVVAITGATDDVTLMRKLRILAESNTALVQQLFAANEQ